MITYQIDFPNNIIDENDYEQIALLLSELSPDKKRSAEDISNAFLGFKKQSATFIALARDDGKVVGMALQIFVQNWFGVHSFIHDVVVLKEYRGSMYGIFDHISELFLEQDKKMGARHSDLTCGATREAAHKAYQKNGWKRREDSALFRRSVS